MSGQFAGRYAIERQIGKGATAIVYLARDAIEGQLVALKVLRPALVDSRVADSFAREIRRTLRLQHSHIVRVLASGNDDGQLYIVMPYMEGGTLRQRLERERQLPISDAVTIARVIAEALEYAHQQKLVHRDVKPENILFTSGEACLGDFGIARALEKGLGETSSTSGMVRGTLAYMSPEQASAERKIDGRSDVYSLGCVLYEMLAGVPAFTGPNPEAILAARFAHPPRELSVYRPTVPAALEVLVHKALQFSAADRFRSAGEMATALGEVQTEPDIPRFSGPAMPARSSHRWPNGSRRLVAAGDDRTFSLRKATRAPVIAGAALVLVAAAAALLTSVNDRPQLDPRRYAVMPFLDATVRSAGNTLSGEECQVLVNEALSYWTGIELVDGMSLRSAYDQHVAGRPTLSSVLSAARALGAGIAVWGDVRVIGDSTHVRAALYDVRKRNRVIHEASVVIGPGQSDALAKLGALARGLLFGGEEEPSAADLTGTRSIEAARAYTEGHRALRLWDLASARRYFERAIELDPAYAHANLWLVQTSSLEGLQSHAALRDAAIQAVTLSDRLSAADRVVAFALLDLIQGRFESACKRYGAMVERDSGSFRAWYGLGECQAMDPLVLRDDRSPSGWRFRSSPSGAIAAYTRALDLTPRASRAFRGRSFERLAQMFFVETARSKRGFALVGGDTVWFLGFPGISGDTVAFVPHSVADLRARKYPALPPMHAVAVSRNREILRSITERWAEAFPRSADAVEGHARMLEAAGELGSGVTRRDNALFLLRQALTLSTDPEQRFRLATGQVRVLFKIGEYDRAARLADSLLAAETPSDAESVRRTSALAALRGQVHRAAALIAGSRALAAPLTVPMLPDGTRISVPTSVLEPALSLYVYAAFGGPADSIRALWLRTETAVRLHVPAERRDSVGLAALYDAASVVYGAVGPTPYHRHPPPNAFGLLQVQIAAMAGDTSLARARVDSMVAQQRHDPSRPIAPQSALQYSQLMLAARDTTRAAAALDALIEGLPLRPEDYFHDPVRIAIIVRAMAKRAEIAAWARDTAQAKRWANVVLTLWDGADPILWPQTNRMRSIAGPHRRR